VTAEPQPSSGGIVLVVDCSYLDTQLLVLIPACHLQRCEIAIGAPS